MMKKFLPVSLLILGLGVLLGVYFIFLKPDKNEAEKEETGVIEVSLNDRPVTSLTPSKDGHWLKLKIEKIKIADAQSMDYELLYELPDGRKQGVPGTVDLKGKTLIERELLLGSESSGKFRYDEGVEEGDLTLRFRNSKGKLITKFTTKFHLQSDEAKLTSLTGNFSVTLDKAPKGTFFVTMETFGIPEAFDKSVTAGPYGVFTSYESPLAGTVSSSGSVYGFVGGDWNLVSGKEFEPGIFIVSSQ